MHVGQLRRWNVLHDRELRHMPDMRHVEWRLRERRRWSKRRGQLRDVEHDLRHDGQVRRRRALPRGRRRYVVWIQHVVLQRDRHALAM